MKPNERMIFYEGKYVELKVLEEKDIYESNWVGWFNNEKLCLPIKSLIMKLGGLNILLSFPK